jgi:hypothetical protein
MSTIEEVYEKYKHLDVCLGDPGWGQSGDSAAIYAIAGELWRAVKEARGQPTERIPNYHYCLHKEIRNGVEFCHFHDKEIHATLAEHDARIAAQARKRREAARPLLPDKTCDPSCPCRTPVCEETCQHSRIYSPVQMQQAIAQATEAERARLTQGRKVITLCGSVKFWDEYIRQNAILTLQGNIVLSCGLSLKEGYEDILVDLPIDDVKRDLDFLHLRKIDLSDEIFVLDVGGYIGDSTQREIEYALSTGKKVRYLESLRLAQPEPTEREPE